MLFFILIVRANARAKSINYAVHQSTSKLLHLPLGQPTLLATGWSVGQQCCNSVISKSNSGTMLVLHLQCRPTIKPMPSKRYSIETSHVQREQTARLLRQTHIFWNCDVIIQSDPQLLLITDAWDLSKNSGNPAFAHPNLCPERVTTWMSALCL